jgi:hypothetical protein
MRSDRACLLLALAMGGVGCAVVAAALPTISTIESAPLLLLAGLVVAARLPTLPVYGRASYSISSVPVLAAAVLLGAAGAVAVALVSGVANAALRRLRWHKALFNCGNYVLAAALAGTAFHAAGVRLSPENLPLLIPLAAAIGLLHYTHVLLTAFAIAAEHRTSPLGAWSEHFAWLWPHYAVLGVLALLLALAADLFGVAGAAAFVVPPVIMLYTARQHLDRTSDGVERLRQLGGTLTDLGGRLAGEVQRRADAEAEVARLGRELTRLRAELGSAG